MSRSYAERLRFESTDVVCKAASDHVGTSLLYVQKGGALNNNTHKARSTLYGSAVHKLGFKATPVVVALSTLDKELGNLGVKSPAILKTDTQGHELSVLKGATALLQKGTQLYIEFDPFLLNEAGTSAFALLSYLHTFGYTCAYANRKHHCVDVRHNSSNAKFWQKCSNDLHCTSHWHTPAHSGSWPCVEFNETQFSVHHQKKASRRSM
mmetsp:Transcript_41547/g.69109  ORF Transcript_41547/g.69109 Transcript_41547/m.69109 type:complete len:209 (-) Transcript_41547:115-741(-)